MKIPLQSKLNVLIKKKKKKKVVLTLYELICIDICDIYVISKQMNIHIRWQL